MFRVWSHYMESIAVTKETAPFYPYFSKAVHLVTNGPGKYLIPAVSINISDHAIMVSFP